MLDWANMTGPAIQALDRDNTIVVVASSPLEVHGPHLPMCTDIAEAEALMDRVADKLMADRPQLTFVRLPPLYVAADVLPHVGSIRFRQSTIVRVLQDLGRSLAAQGFKHIWVTGFHGGPRHFVSVEKACDRVNRRHGARMVSVFSLLLSELTGGRTDLADVLHHVDGVTRQDLEGDAHGGVVETSLMLRILGQHVDASYRDLPQNTVDLDRDRRGLPPADPKALGTLVEKLRFYETHTFSGNPSKASEQLGEQFLDILSDHAASAMAKVLDGQTPLDAAHSPVWNLRAVFTSDWLTAVFERAVGYTPRVW